MNKTIQESINYVDFCTHQTCKTCPLKNKGDCENEYRMMKRECAKMATTILDKIKWILESMDFNELIVVWNAFCDETRSIYQVYGMDEFDEYMYDVKPWEISRSAFFGDFNPTHDYFTFNGDGNLESFDYFTDENCPIVTSDIAEFIIQTKNTLDNDDLQEALHDTI